MQFAENSFLKMQWDEDIWEDISDPPSPGPGETGHLFSIFNADRQLSRFDNNSDDPLNEILEIREKFRRHSVDLSACLSLTNDPHGKSKNASIDLEDVHKIAQELIESYQTLIPLAKSHTDFHEQDQHSHGPEQSLIRGDNQNSTEALSSTPKSFETVLTKAASKKLNRTTYSNSIKDPGPKVGLLKSNKSKIPSLKQQTKPGIKTPHVNTTKVPQLLCKPTPCEHQITALQNGSAKKVSATSSVKPKCRFTENLSPKDYNLKEYQKRPTQRTLVDRYRDLNNYRTDIRTAYGDLYDDEEEDRAKAIVCVVFCIMGLGLIVGIVCLISRYAEQAATGSPGSPPEDQDDTDFMNEIYYRRVADVIKLAMTTEDTLRGRNISDEGISNRLCDKSPPNLLGNTTGIELNITVDIEDLISNNLDVQTGGEWGPQTCIARHRVAIIIPYRDRWNHLKVLLHYLIPTLKRQQIHFRIFIVEQYGNETFNKGSIMNAAFREALKLYDFHCVTFHDVDLVPEDDRNMYTCTEQPKHMSHSIDKFQYILPYQGLVGGVLMFKRDHFQLVNGYSNMYWGWGAEDDDMTTRILIHGLRIYRPPSNIAKYKMVKHDGRKSSEVAVRMKLLRSAAKRSKFEGLNNVKYTLLFTHLQKLFTHFIVDIGAPIT